MQLIQNVCSHCYLKLFQWSKLEHQFSKKNYNMHEQFSSHKARIRNDSEVLGEDFSLIHFKQQMLLNVASLLILAK